MSTTTTTSLPTPNCGNSYYPKTCPLRSPPPIDGRNGPCYRTPFFIPTCNYNTSPNDTTTTTTTPFLQNPTITWEQLDVFYADHASHSALYGLAIGLSLLTLLNILVLTPNRKRPFLVHWALLLGTTMQLVRSVIAVYLRIWGVGGATYLQITGDWASTELSVTWRGLVVTQQVVGCLAVTAVHVAFWCQCRGLLVWVRLRGRRGGGGRTVYWGILGVLAGLGLASWGWRVAFAVYQVYWVGSAEVWDEVGWRILNVGGAVTVGVSFGCWSLAFVVSAGWMLWERRRVVSGGEFGAMAGGSGKRSRMFQGVCEKALNMIGFVGVESFLIPLVFSILNAISVTPAIEILLVPTVLALLPMSSLFIQGSQNDNAQRPGHDEQLHIVSHPDIGNVEAHHNAGIDAAKRQYRPINQPVQRSGVSAGMLVDRELREIDNMR